MSTLRLIYVHFEVIIAISFTNTYRAFLLSFRSTKKVNDDTKTKGFCDLRRVCVCQCKCVLFLFGYCLHQDGDNLN